MQDDNREMTIYEKREIITSLHKRKQLKKEHLMTLMNLTAVTDYDEQFKKIESTLLLDKMKRLKDKYFGELADLPNYESMIESDG